MAGVHLPSLEAHCFPPLSTISHHIILIPFIYFSISGQHLIILKQLPLSLILCVGILLLFCLAYILYYYTTAWLALKIFFTSLIYLDL